MATRNCIFIVDDDLSARRGLARLLRTAGYEVRDYASVSEFLGAIGDEAPECLVLDARMPGVSGEDVQSALKKRGVHLPIIVVSGDDDPGTRRLAQILGAVAFFRKPVDGTALLDAVEWALQRNGAGGDPEKA
jgi:FixJ family two-component response regulator